MIDEKIARFFNSARLHIQSNPNLRDPQVEGWFRTRQHFRNSSEHAIIQIPVGCGKTGLLVKTRPTKGSCTDHREKVF